jgi:hypothetical protein
MINLLSLVDKLAPNDKKVADWVDEMVKNNPDL